MRRDIDEVVDFVPIDFILNVVLDEHKNVIKAVAGHYLEAHRSGCEFLDKLYKVKIKERADIVVVSAGGYPKDINLYQVQKALDNAKHAVRDGGIIILVASCKEGFGERVFEQWIEKSDNPDYLIQEIKRNFELGGHKAAAIAMVLKKCDIYLISELEDSLVKKAFMKPYYEVQTAYDDAIKKLGDNHKVIIMPFGGSTLPTGEIQKVETMSKSVSDIANQSSSLSNEVAAAVEEQTANLEEISSSASVLYDMSEELNKIVKQFKY